MVYGGLQCMVILDTMSGKTEEKLLTHSLNRQLVYVNSKIIILNVFLLYSSEDQYAHLFDLFDCNIL